MLVFRILHKKHSDALFATGIEGRWNSHRKKVLYCSESIPLAFMESMIRGQGVGFNSDFQIAHINVPDTVVVQSIDTDRLGKSWNNPHDYSSCQKLGDEWYDQQAGLVLKIPSAVLSVCYNYMFNTIHSDFRKVKLLKLTPLMPDPRIDEMLKKVK